MISSEFSYSPKAPPPNIITLGIKALNVWLLWGHKHSVHRGRLEPHSVVKMVNRAWHP